MTPGRLFLSRGLVSGAIAIMLSSTVVFTQAGWHKAGSHPADYDMGSDPTTAFTGNSSGFIKSNKPAPAGFGTYMQTIDAAEYRGKRVRLSTQVKSQGIVDWAGVWMRVDSSSGPIAFDNMQDRPIKGTQEWTNHVIVLDVRSNATAIAFGILLSGKGSVWIDDVGLEAVGQDVLVTDVLKKRAVQPRNLCRLAGHYLQRERRDHTLQATELVNELYLKLFSSGPVEWQDRAHFFAVAGRQLRRILVDHARTRGAGKRGGDAIRLSLTEAQGVSTSNDVDVLDVDEALTRLEALDARAASGVELRFFSGLTETEIVEVLGVSIATVRRDWKFARAWLISQLAPSAIDGRSSTN